MDRSVGKNYFYNLIYQITLILIPLITIPYISEVLGPTGIGINSFTNSIAQYFILAGTLGMTIYGNRTIATVRNDKEKCRSIFWEIFILQLVTCVASFSIYILIFGFNNKYSLYYLMQSMYILAAAVDITWYFMGVEDFKKASLRSTFVKLVSVVAMFIFVKDFDDLWKYILINSLSMLIGQIIMWFYVDKSFLKIKYLKNIHILTHLKPALQLFIPQVAIQVYMVLDKTMTGVLANETEVGFYDNSQKIIRLSLAIVTSLGMVMLPKIANLYSSGELNKMKEHLQKAFRFMTMISLPLIFGLIGISDNFVPWFFGKEFLKVINLMKLSSIMILVIAWGNVFGTQYILALGKMKEYTTSVVIGAIINFSLNLVLIPRLLSLGAVIATLCAEIIIAGIQLYYSKEIVTKEWFYCGWKYWISSVIMFLGVYFIGNLVNSNLVGTCIQIITGAVIYFVMLIIFKDKILIDLFHKVKLK
ncbi:flippase [Clostridium intestinale]|uniref:PST family polysaccharide transporter n=1 Tax=Clostridium intestinale URNW TaxID=1294142 RepID=U2N9Q0_9CLOT|nr:flippase [Clostridium intestinale]ERK32242.1 PST family polysaccharide transporter [Clostridium intestinale URNW]